jgi:hypothetical protein
LTAFGLVRSLLRDQHPDVLGGEQRVPAAGTPRPRVHEHPGQLGDPRADQP